MFKKTLPTSRALRQGGEGTTPPPKSGGDPFDLGKIKGPASTPKPQGPTQIGRGVTPPKMPRSPLGPKSPKPPRAPQMPKVGKFR